MEDFSEYLIDQTRSGGAALHEFLLRFEDSDVGLHLFFEGGDDPNFYLPHVRRLVPRVHVWHYVCGGKWEVDGVREYLYEKGYPLCRILFFVDRDFDDLLDRQIRPDPNCYISDYYSIENYIVSVSSAEILLLEVMGISQSDPGCVEFLDGFDELMSEWFVKVRPFMALVLAAKDVGLKANLNNARLDKMFGLCVVGRKVEKQCGATRTFVRGVFPPQTVVPFKRILYWRRRLSELHPKLWVRGKYELWFFESVILKFLDDLIAARRGANQKVPRVPASLRERRLFDVLAGRTPTPSSLVEFFRGSVGLELGNS